MPIPFKSILLLIVYAIMHKVIPKFCITIKLTIYKLLIAQILEIFNLIKKKKKIIRV
jgi:hypothetical protein